MMDSALALGGNGQQQQMEGSAMDSLAMDGSESSKMQRWTARDGQLAKKRLEQQWMAWRNGRLGNEQLAMDWTARNGTARRWSKARRRD
jgi:hypothetical protein